MRKLDYVQMGKRIRTQRENLGLTREKLAEELSVSSKFIVDIEAGTKGMSLHNFNALCGILDVSSDYLLNGTKEVSDPERELLNDNIKEYLRACDKKQLKAMEQITKFYVESIK
ncbi:MAG: helix-turn-helix domain-containing protein [Clostridia bacterium]|nr:helix-turn-helix domain-containing protein [Clostridia bacterium]